MKIAFLDRDGVINRYPGHRLYVTKLKDFHFLPGSLEAIKTLSKAGFKIFVISNQAGVSKGIYSKNKLEQITQVMLKKIRGYGGKINSVFYCIHRKEENCSCRKPKTGLIKKALNVLGLKNLRGKKTFLIGDSLMDVATGKNAGLKTILVLSGREKLRNKKSWAPKPDFVARNLWDATKIILDENSDYPRLSRPRSQALRRGSL